MEETRDVQDKSSHSERLDLTSTKARLGRQAYMYLAHNVYSCGAVTSPWYCARMI